MPNEYANKIVINGQTRIDLTGDTVTADKLMQGITAHDRSGAPITGTHDDLTAEPLSVSANGTYTAPAGKAYTPVTVAVPSPGTQTRTATPSLSTQSITPDSGNLLSKVTVNPITAQLLASLDADFVAGNIKKDVDLFGLIGTLESGGEVEIATGTVTFAADTYSYEFLESGDIGKYDVFILFPEYTSTVKTLYSDARYIWAMAQYRRAIGGYGVTWIILGRNDGSGKYYAPYVDGANVAYFGSFYSSNFNGKLGAITYRWFAIGGVNIT